MTKGIKSYNHKERRKVRRQNHLARDLRSPLSKQRRRNGLRQEDEKFNYKDWNAYEDFEND
jgi:hypothetical protein